MLPASEPPKKTKYRVTVQRIEFQTHDFVVEAESMASAATNGMIAALDHDFSGECRSAEENVIAVTPLLENEETA